MVIAWPSFSILSNPLPQTHFGESFPFISKPLLPLSPVRLSRSISSSVPIIGISGGVGSGKSTVIRHVSRLRLLIIDADRIAHELLATDEIISAIRKTFGDGVVDDQGRIDRRQLAELVFGAATVKTADQEGLDAEATLRSRRQLEEILHPAIHQEIVRRIREVPSGIEAVILDAALLLEVGWAQECDAVIFIDTPTELRIQRVQENRGWTAAELARRESAQWPLEKKKSFAGFVVDNSGSVESAAGEMERVLRTIISQFQASNPVVSNP